MCQIIEEKRKKLGFTQEEVAKILGIKRNTLSQYETGKRKPRGKIAKKLATVLEIPLEDIV